MIFSEASEDNYPSKNEQISWMEDEVVRLNDQHPLTVTIGDKEAGKAYSFRVKDGAMFCDIKLDDKFYMKTPILDYTSIDPDEMTNIREIQILEERMFDKGLPLIVSVTVGIKMFNDDIDSPTVVIGAK